jgi:hypothetical protein
MKDGGLDAGLFAARGDYPLIRHDPAGRRYEGRKPRAGELLRRSTEQLDRILEAIKNGKLALGRSPAESSKPKRAASPASCWPSKAAIPWKATLHE